MVAKLPDTTDKKLRERVISGIEKALLPGCLASPATDVAVLGYVDSIKDLTFLVDHLMLHPEKVARAKRLIERDLVAGGPQLTKAGLAEAPWPAQYGVWEKIPNCWMWAWICGRYPEFTPKVIESLQKEEKRICWALRELATGLRDQSPIDTRLRDKCVMAKFLGRMADQRSTVLKGWVSRCVSEDGKVDWSKGGAFRATKIEDGRIKEFVWLFDGGKARFCNN